ncbi:TlyA family RNA methyltransferase [Pectinatus brassicae]|uniref:23S rRNA (Cytidine1920-2'-O)/16S rRNA (Cytidine1409-2'-O)-methyltransferase n=1 Tax=Pectinatus brassicae TaxID=862415 RepID=A0A840UQC5_9FIRM|nr:TlyA family RNA methyltransferase [Pectinatus brassicae]MBB5336382.1 23S rRNA (cytidine1920-2'-O)/16S rRNA (cytidine1409-2'-O)-methyltransferase [Pectinatus brassicae]
MKKQRLDVVLVEKGLEPSRERAKATIMAGLVLVNEQKIDKAGTMIDPELPIRVLGDSIGYVSRGGLKLEKAISAFDLDLQDKVCIDIGASTGGFTDCALKNGAKKVFAIDVGYGQLAWALRTDERVINMERTNIRYVTPTDLGELADFASIDVAFISLEKVLPVAKTLLMADGEIAALIKPQFEAGREFVGKKGVVKEPAVHKAVIKKIVDFSLETGFIIKALTFSPIKGPEGNIEYLIHLSNSQTAAAMTIDDAVIDGIVTDAHKDLDKKSHH